MSELKDNRDEEPKDGATHADAPAGEAEAEPERSGRPRKERVLHTRIPEVLENELKQLATSLRVPVSNLVRTILQDAIEAAELVGRAAEQELRGAADRLARERERMHGAASARGAQLGRAAAGTPPADPALLEGVLGYQAFVLAVATRCARCGRSLAVGGEAFLGVRETPGPRVIIGPECLPGR